MSFSEFAGKYGKEPRFKAIDKMKEREALYNEFLKETKHKRSTEAKERTAKVCLRWFPAGPPNIF